MLRFPIRVRTNNTRHLSFRHQIVGVRTEIYEVLSSYGTCPEIRFDEACHLAAGDYVESKLGALELSLGKSSYLPSV